MSCCADRPTADFHQPSPTAFRWQSATGQGLVAAILQAPPPVRMCDPSNAPWHPDFTGCSLSSVDLAWLLAST